MAQQEVKLIHVVECGNCGKTFELNNTTIKRAEPWEPQELHNLYFCNDKCCRSCFVSWKNWQKPIWDVRDKVWISKFEKQQKSIKDVDQDYIDKKNKPIVKQKQGIGLTPGFELYD